MTRFKLSTALPLALAAGFAFFGVQKFGAENLVFEIIAERSGLPIFEPYVRILTGLGELTTAALLAFPNARSRLLGALMGVAILIGAIGFHLSPWLGIHVPGIGNGLFATAVAMLALTSVYAATLLRAVLPNAQALQTVKLS
jgi:hypothetical protein